MGKALTLHINYGPGAGVKDLDLEWNGDTPDAESLLTILDRVIPWLTASAVAHAVMESFQQEPNPEPDVVEDDVKVENVTTDPQCRRVACGHGFGAHAMSGRGTDGTGCLLCDDLTKCQSFVSPLNAEVVR